MIKKLMLLMGISLAVNTVAYSAQITECDYDRDTGNVTVSGTADISTDNEITVNVKENGKTVYEGQTTANNGKYQFSFKLTGSESKTYNVKVGEKGVYTAAADSFVYYGSQADDKLALLKKYADADNLTDFKNTLSNSVPVLGIKLSQAETEQLKNIADIVMASVKNESQITVGKLENIINDALFVQMVRVCGKPSELDEIFKNNSKRITDEYPLLWSKYTSGTDSQKEGICSKFIEHITSLSSLSEESIIESFAVETAAYYINNAAGWENAKNFISDVKAEIGINAATLSSDSRVYNNMMNSVYKAKEDFNKAYNLPVSEPSSPGSGKSNSSGGGSIGGSSNNYTPSTPLPNVQTKIFNDLDNVEWAKTAIEALAKDGVINGKAEGKFAPADNILREESAAMISRLFNMSIPENKTGFIDIASGAWYENYCYALKSSEIVKGINENKFGIGEYITRQDFVTIICRAMQKYNIFGNVDENADIFPDSESIAEYARESANYLKKSGIIE
ncbi:MAG: S-layer homology domain-containing protein, partial [Clostridia bacterium]|nr:S-layer homology domain-containing protein [Clostridia bacterium]